MNKKIFYGIFVVLGLLISGFGILFYRDVLNFITAPKLQIKDGKAVLSVSYKILYPHEHRLNNTVYEHGKIADSGFIRVPEDIWVKKMEIVVENAHLNIVHHVFLADVITGKEFARFGSDNIYAPVVIQDPYAYFIPKNTLLYLEVMLHNPLPPFGPGDLYEDISVKFVMDIEQAPRYNVHNSISFFTVSLEDVEGSRAFYVPPLTLNFLKEGQDRVYPAAWKHTFSSSGKIIYGGAHIHASEGGKNVKVYINDQLVKEYISEKKDEYIWDTERSPLDWEIEKGDILYITSEYSNPYDIPINGAMGMFGFLFVDE